MPGAVTLLSDAKASGWAVHPYLARYAVLVHVVYQTRIIRSVLADQPAPPGEDINPGSWFHVALADLNIPDGDALTKLAFLIGETDEYLPVSSSGPKTRTPARPRVVTVEDMIYENASRHWVTGATYIEAEQAGLADSDIIDLLYRDILGRPADPDGLAAYMFQRREGIRTFGDIRKSLLESEEYRRRPKRAATAPGAVFSQQITLLAATALTEPDEVQPRSPSTPSVAPARPLTVPRRTRPISRPMEPAVAAWPVYAERPLQTIVSDLDPAPTDELEVALPMDSVLFGSGWYNVESLNGNAFRWMGPSGVIFNAKPGLACTSVVLSVAAVYGAHMPMLDCYLDDATADVDVTAQGEGFTVRIMPRQALAQPFTKLQIESRASGCPLQDDRGSDDRMLSLNLMGALMLYRQRTSNHEA